MKHFNTCKAWNQEENVDACSFKFDITMRPQVLNDTMDPSSPHKTYLDPHCNTPSPTPLPFILLPNISPLRYSKSSQIPHLKSETKSKYPTSHIPIRQQPVACLPPDFSRSGRTPRDKHVQRLCRSDDQGNWLQGSRATEQAGEMRCGCCNGISCGKVRSGTEAEAASN